MPAPITATLFSTVFCDSKPDLRQIEGLTALAGLDSHATQITTTPSTTRRSVSDDLVRIGNERQVPTVMAWLAARFAS
jgi:hypothetical protein